MAANRFKLLALLGRSPLGTAILMTLAAVFIAGLLPLEAQAGRTQAAQPDSKSTAMPSPDTRTREPHERHW